MKESTPDRLGGDKSSIAIILTLTALVAYMGWVGISGHPLPRWILWLTTFL